MASVTDRGNNQYVVHLPHADLFVDREQLRSLVLEGAAALRIPLGDKSSQVITPQFALRLILQPDEIMLAMAVIKDTLRISLQEAKEIVTGRTERLTSADEVALLNDAFGKQTLDTRVGMEQA